MKHRVVSLIASGTEIVSALGYRDCLVGRSHECDFPPDVLNLPVCSEPRIDVSASSGEIDRQVRATVGEVLSVYSVFQNELDRLQPTTIITQSQCDVCAVNLRDVEAALADMTGVRPQVVSLEPMCLSDIWTDIERVAVALDEPSSGQNLIQSLQNRLEDLRATVPTRSANPTVFCMEWLEPLMSAANWVPELVELAGGTPVLCESGKHAPNVTWDDLVKSDPQVIAIMPCGFGISRTLDEIHLLTENPAWSALQAVRNNQVYVVDGNHFFNRPGPRIVESAEILFDLLNGREEESGSGIRWTKLA
ncbi:MAG: cobalamin-binding protein [Fuerstiella sp.]